VALSAFDSFCRGAEEGKFPRLEDRTDLWKLLLVITARKANRLLERELAQKRGGGKVYNASGLADADDPDAALFADLIGREPEPDFEVSIEEELGRMLQLLPDERLRQIALWKMQGLDSAEIAARLNRAPATVDRKLRLVQDIWEREIAR
jgi:DNA-directed RNA polymerase specialized sigma24 family protein